MMRKLLVGVMAVALVFGMQMVVYAQVDTTSAADEVIDLTPVVGQGEAATDDQTTGDETAPEETEDITALQEGDALPGDAAAGDDLDGNPETGMNQTMLPVSGGLLVLSVVAVILTTRKRKTQA